MSRMSVSKIVFSIKVTSYFISRGGRMMRYEQNLTVKLLCWLRINCKHKYKVAVCVPFSVLLDIYSSRMMAYNLDVDK